MVQHNCMDDTCKNNRYKCVFGNESQTESQTNRRKVRLKYEVVKNKHNNIVFSSM